ncbi:MAG: hypothetical protein L0312_06070, partial [Acidobacteria bacterium]|nr:hypothetical protein [Acidobacteriota bacterium]
MKNITILATLLSLCISGSGRIFNIRFSCLRLLVCCLWLFAGLLLVGSPAQAEIKAGDILVVDAIGGTNGSGSLFLVNPTTGQRTVLSDFGNPAQGHLGNGDLTGVAVGRAGQIFVSALFSGDPAFEGGALFTVDPDTGNRILLSNFSQGDIRGLLFQGLAVNAKGKVIASLDRSEPPAFEFHFALVRVDPKTDARVLVSDLKNPAQGPTVSGFITDLTLEHSGKILIGTARGSGQPDSAIFRVHPVTGKRRLLSDFANPAQGADEADLQFNTGLAVETSGQILAASGGSVPRNLLLRIDPKTG